MVAPIVEAVVEANETGPTPEVQEEKVDAEVIVAEAAAPIFEEVIENKPEEKAEVNILSALEAALDKEAGETD